MDSAYDQIQGENYSQDPAKQAGSGSSAPNETANNLNAEIQDAYKAISSSPWAARIGGFFGTVKKQSEQYIDTASKQYATTSKTASAGVSTLIGHARNLSINAESALKSPTTETPPTDHEAHPDRPDSLPADIVKEATSVFSRLRSTAAARFKDIEKAEDAADEALLKFGSNIRNFLADAVSIAPPASGSEAEKNGDVLFESKDSTGKKVVHATRFDAQLHVIHSTLDSFLKDPVSPEWDVWRKDFDVEKKTDAIAKDLEKHTELRSAMEKCVPEKVEYGTFWERYYFLRHVIESEELRRREMLKASAPTADEEVAWDEESSADEADPETDPKSKPDDPASEASDDEDETSDDESESASESSTPANKSSTNLAASKETLRAPAGATLKPKTQPEQPRRSNDEKSVADSDASYDVVSGATSRAPGSPQAVGEKKGEKEVVGAKKEEDEESEEESDEDEDSEEEDWE